MVAEDRQRVGGQSPCGDVHRERRQLSGDAVDDPTILKTTGPTRKVKTGVGLGQPGEGVLGRASYLQLGSFRLEAPTAACCSGNPDDVRKIGTEVLRRFTVILDYTRNRMILEPNSHFKENFPDA